jgi:hypothetical protein
VATRVEINWKTFFCCCCRRHSTAWSWTLKSIKTLIAVFNFTSLRRQPLPCSEGFYYFGRLIKARAVHLSSCDISDKAIKVQLAVRDDFWAIKTALEERIYERERRMQASGVKISHNVNDDNPRGGCEKRHRRVIIIKFATARN